MWTGERSRPFGDFDYSKIKTEAEALDLLQEKYKVQVPEYYEITKKTLLDELSSKTVIPKEALYSIFSQNKELVFKTLYPFYKEKELQVFAEVVLTYTYSADRKEAYLKSQIININIAPVKGELPNKNVSELIEVLGKNMNISEKEINSGLAGYEKQVKETKSIITTDYLPVVSTSRGLNTDKDFLKEIAVGYDPSGTLREFHAEVSDQMTK
ncbi:hypothetical protein [Enterococcus caccae]|nr:hypothetical protein [Enterococcus caccae]OJG25617.1 hypothetical protein RU98_GL000858 [Enterococcus caccae]